MIKLFDRVGGALVAPRRTLEAVDRRGARAKAGVDDALALLALKVLATETRALATAVAMAISASVMGALNGVARTIVRAVSVDLALIFGAGVIIWIAAGRRRAASRDFDLAVVAWIPVLVVDLIAALAAVALGGLPQPARLALAGTALVWMLALVVVAVLVARAREQPR